MKTKLIIKNLSIALVTLLLIAIMLLPKQAIKVEAGFENNINHKSSVLIEKNSGQILVDNNAHEH